MTKILSKLNIDPDYPFNKMVNSNAQKVTRLLIIADKRMDWAARLTIASARIKAGYCGEIVMIGECDHPVFDREMGVEYHDWMTAGEGLLPDSQWGVFRKPQIKPFLIRKYFKPPTIFLDADVYCAGPFDSFIHDCRNWACAITKYNPNMLSIDDLKLWGLDEKPVHQFNSGVLFIKDKTILDQWCAVFEEAVDDPVKYDYLMNRQPWSYDQIGLIIASARSKCQPEKLDHSYNFEVAEKGWTGVESASIIHFTNWKVVNLPELLCLSEKAPSCLKMAEVGCAVQQIEDLENFQPPLMSINNTIRSQKAIGLIKKKMTRRLIVGVSQGVGEAISATPMLKALSSMGWQIDLPSGVFKNNADEALVGLDIRIVDAKTAKNSGPYAAALQSVWPVRGIERLSSQAFYAAPCESAWKHNLFIHEVEANMSLAYAMGYKGPIPSLHCNTQSVHNPYSEKLLGKFEPLIGLYLTSASSDSIPTEMRLESPEKIANSLASRGWCVVLLGRSEIKIDPFQYPDNFINLIGNTRISHCADIIAKLNALVTTDCEITHVAAAMDCPQVIISNYALALKNRPWSNKTQVLYASPEYTPRNYTLLDVNANYDSLLTVDPELITNHVERLIKSVPRRKTSSE